MSPVKPLSPVRFFVATLIFCVQMASAASADEKPAALQQPDSPKPSAKVDAHALAAEESILKFCTRVQPASVAVLERKRQAMVRGISPADLARLRESAEYRAAFAAEDQFVGVVDERNFKRICPIPAAKGS
jgi:hypothetical protein